MPDATIDVVIPVRNGGAYIADCLDSVLAQTHPIARIFVSDDGSTDNTAAVVATYAARDNRITFMPSVAGGVSSARNRGIRASHAAFIAFIDADDRWLPAKLEKQMAVFAAGNDKLGAVHCAYEYINADGSKRTQDTPIPPKKRGDLFQDLLFHQYVLSGSASAAVVKRSALDDVGLMDERLFLGEDWDLWIRIAEKYDWDFSPDTLTQIRVHDASAQRRPDPERDRKYLFQHIIIYNRWYGKLPFPPEVFTRLRDDAARIMLKRYFKPSAVIELYQQLKNSEYALARDMFPGFFFYCRCLLPMAAMLVATKIRRLILKVFRQ